MNGGVRITEEVGPAQGDRLPRPISVLAEPLHRPWQPHVTVALCQPVELRQSQEPLGDLSHISVFNLSR